MIKNKTKIIESTVRIGKNGITNSLIQEIKKQLKKRKIVKVKMLNSFIKTKNKKDAATEIAIKTNSKIISLVGFTVVLKKQK